MVFKKVFPGDLVIPTIAQWYFQEWNIPATTTIEKLNNQENNGIIFQYILYDNKIPLVTGGLYREVGLSKVFPDYSKFNPWIALLFTDKNFRGRGLGRMMLEEIEKQAVASGFKELFLFTLTAEKLYSKSGWIKFSEEEYKGQKASVMRKPVS